MDTGNYPYKTYNTRMDFGGDDECDISYEKCRRLEVIAKKVQKEHRKKIKPVIKEKDIFDGFIEKKKKKKNKY